MDALAGIDDVNYNIMMNMDFESLEFLCLTNKYASKLCNNQQFWLDKIKYDGLLTPNKELLIGGMKAYYICNIITNYIENDKVYKVLTVNDVDIVEGLLYKYQKYLGFDNSAAYYHFDVVTGYIDQKGIFRLAIKTSKGKMLYETAMTKQNYVNFLYEGLITKSVNII